MPVSGRHIERCLTGSSLRLFNLLYCKYLIPPRCLLAISGRINRRGARQKGQNEYLRLSDMPPPAFSLHLDVARLTHRATWNDIVSSNNVFAGKSNLFGSYIISTQFTLTLPEKSQTLLSSYLIMSFFFIYSHGIKASNTPLLKYIFI